MSSAYRLLSATGAGSLVAVKTGLGDPAAFLGADVDIGGREPADVAAAILFSAAAP